MTVKPSLSGTYMMKRLVSQDAILPVLNAAAFEVCRLKSVFRFQVFILFMQKMHSVCVEDGRGICCIKTGPKIMYCEVVCWQVKRPIFNSVNSAFLSSSNDVVCRQSVMTVLSIVGNRTTWHPVSPVSFNTSADTTWHLKSQRRVKHVSRSETMCVQPEEDFNDDLMFPMPNRLSLAGAPESELDLAQPLDDLDTSPMQKKRLVRSSSDPSINTGDRVPGIPPYPAPPGYQRDFKVRVTQRVRKTQRLT